MGSRDGRRRGGEDTESAADIEVLFKADFLPEETKYFFLRQDIRLTTLSESAKWEVP